MNRVLINFNQDELVAAIAACSKYFSEQAFEKALEQDVASTSTVVLMSPADYISLCDPGDDYLLAADVIRGIVDPSCRYDDIPYLGVETDPEDNSLYVSLNGKDHVGRRIMRALNGLGVEKVPVQIYSQGYDGPAYVWGCSESRPTELWGYDDNMIAFSKTYPF